MPVRMWGREQIEWQDRSWRLLENRGQVECDVFSSVGAVVGAGVVAGHGWRGMVGGAGWRGMVGGAGLGGLLWVVDRVVGMLEFSACGTLAAHTRMHFESLVKIINSAT